MRLLQGLGPEGPRAHWECLSQVQMVPEYDGEPAACVPHRSAARWSDSAVFDHVVIDNSCVAEIVEADVFAAVEPWHQLSDQVNRASGYTEMWSAGVPTVDLRAFAAKVACFSAKSDP